MALNKSGLPPMIKPMSRAKRPGGEGTVSPGDLKKGNITKLGSLTGKPPTLPTIPGIGKNKKF